MGFQVTNTVRQLTNRIRRNIGGTGGGTGGAPPAGGTGGDTGRGERPFKAERSC